MERSFSSAVGVSSPFIPLLQVNRNRLQNQDEDEDKREQR